MDQREIKFRAWSKKKLLWVKFNKILFGRVIALQDGFGNFIDGDFEVQQFTGLKDKNGKEIYEGDIVKSDGIYNDKKVVLVGKIEFEDGCFNLLWKWKSPEGSGTYSIKPLVRESKHLEVISNIYENPELLK